MTISSTTNRVSYTGNGVTTAFAFSNPFQVQADLKVLLVLISTGAETLQTITTHYTISGTTTNGVYPNGGTVNMVTAPSALYKLVIYREPALTQAIDLVENDALPAETLEQGLDKAVLITQRLDERLDRAITLPDGFTATFSPTLPADINTANAALVVNAAGDGWDVGPTTTEIADAEANAIAAAASAAAALVSENAAATSAANAALYAAASQWDDVAYKVFSDSPITIADADSGTLYAIDCTAGNVVVNLPAISALSLTGPWSIGFKKTDSSSNTITINRNGTDTIDGSTSKVLSRQYSGTNLIPDADGSPDNWTAMTFGEVPISGAIVGTTDTQSLTNKTISDALTFAEIATPSTPASGFGKTYFKSDGKLYVLDDTGAETQVGSGAGGINFFSDNPDAESSISPFAAYADAAASSPVDMDGGAPTVTITRNTTTPRRGNADFLITKDAANRQGEGVSRSFTIANADKYQMHQLIFEYLPSSAYVDDDVRLYIYDVTNATLIEPIGRDLKATSLGGKHYAYFQATDSTSYRYGFHIASTNASAYTINFDTIAIGPNQLAKGAFVSDWVAYTPTGSHVTNATYTGFYRRVGDTLELRARVVYAGATNAATELTFNLPTGLTIDTAKLNSTSNTDSVLGLAAIQDVSVNDYQGVVSYNSTTSLKVRILVEGAAVASTNTNFTSASPFTIASGDRIQIQAWGIPIVGWASSINVANETSNKTIAFKARLSANQNIATGSLAKITFDTVTGTTMGCFNKGGAFNTSTTRFECPESGTYFFNFVLLPNSNNTAASAYTSQLRKNGTSVKNFRMWADETTSQWDGSAVIELVKGDYVEVYASGDANFDMLGGDAADNCVFEGFKIQGNQTIGMDEVVAASYATDAGQSIPNNTVTAIVFEDKRIDTHNAMNTSTGGYTVPVSGTYLVSTMHGYVGTTAWAITENITSLIYLNGVAKGYSYFVYPASSASSISAHIQNTTIVAAVKGDTISAQALQTSGGSLALIADGDRVQISIIRIK